MKIQNPLGAVEKCSTLVTKVGSSGKWSKLKKLHDYEVVIIIQINL